MRRLPRYGSFAGLGAATLLAALLVGAGSAQAAFPGRDGLLAAQPMNGSGIVLVNANGHGERRLCATSVTGARACSLVRPQWSPDGQTLAVGEPPASSATYGPVPASVSVIYPDGGCLACGFAYNGPAGLVDPAFTGNPTLLTAVAPKARFYRGGLYRFGFDGVARTGPALLAGAVSQPVWSSRGELALVQGGWIWVGSPGKLRRLTRGSAPSWSPDGSRIVFDHGGWLRIVRLQGRSVRRLAPGAAPAWSPDGRWIAFFDLEHRLSVLGISGGRVRRVGKVTGLTVDWQPLPAVPPAACLTPPGSTVLASSDTAIVSLDTVVYGSGFGSSSNWAAMWCLRADGRERVLTSGFEALSGGEEASKAVLAGTYAALEITTSPGETALCMPYVSSITVYDLRTGKGSDYYSNTSCSSSVGPLLLNASGFAAWRVTQSDETEQLYAHDNQGTTIVDSAPAGSGTAISNVQLTGDQLTWTHNGTPHQLTLQ